MNKEQVKDGNKLTKKALNEFIGWTTSRYNNYLGYGTKAEAVDLAYHSLLNGFYTSAWYRKDKTRVETRKPEVTVFDIKCASPVGESGTQKRGSYWNTKQSGDNYIVDCINKTITAVYSKRVISFTQLPTPIT